MCVRARACKPNTVLLSVRAGASALVSACCDCVCAPAFVCAVYVCEGATVLRIGERARKRL